MLLLLGVVVVRRVRSGPMLLRVGLGGFEEGAATPLKRTVSTVPLLLPLQFHHHFYQSWSVKYGTELLMRALLQQFHFVDKNDDEDGGRKLFSSLF